MTVLIRISRLLVALAAFALSFATLMALAELAGYSQLSWLYPVTLDLGTVASCAAWMTSKSRQAFHLTWCLLTASILLNGVEHWLVATGQRPAWWLITVIAMAPPAILGVVTHLAVGLGSPDRNGSDMEVPAGAPGVNRSAGGSTRPGDGETSELVDGRSGPVMRYEIWAGSTTPGGRRQGGGTPPGDGETSLDVRRSGRQEVGAKCPAGSTVPDVARGHAGDTRPVGRETSESGEGRPGLGTERGRATGSTGPCKEGKGAVPRSVRRKQVSCADPAS